LWTTYRGHSVRSSVALHTDAGTSPWLLRHSTPTPTCSQRQSSIYISKRPQFLTVTPQDLTSFKQSLDGRKLSPNYRFQGYPVGSFEKPRDPLHAPVINPKDLTTDADVKYARPHFFDPRKSRGFRKVAVCVCVFYQTSRFREMVRRQHPRRTSKRNV